MIKRLILLLLTLCTMSIAVANEGLDVHPLLILMDHKDHSNAIFITNLAKKTAYIRVSTYKYLHAGLPNQSTQRVKNPRQANLIVTPSRLVIRPRQQRVIRLRIIRPIVDSDQLYSIHIREVAVKPSADNKHFEHADGIMSTEIGFNVLLVHHRVNGVVKVTAKRKGRWVTFKNIGNTTGRIRGLPVCYKKRCRVSVGTIITPGQVRRLQIPFAVPAKFVISDMYKDTMIKTN